MAAQSPGRYSIATEFVSEIAGQILDLIKEAGYVKLAENQELPPFIYLSGSDFNAKSTIQQCMLKAGFRKVEL